MNTIRAITILSIALLLPATGFTCEHCEPIGCLKHRCQDGTHSSSCNCAHREYQCKSGYVNKTPQTKGKNITCVKES